MLTPAQRDQIEIILVSPRNPLNIGAVARAMANFGFDHLTVVAGYAPHWREAKSAVGAPKQLADARETATLAEAVAAYSFVAGTGTLTHRKPEQPVVSLPDLPALLHRELAAGARAALVFGPENHGLTRDDLSLCHVLIEIPTDPRQPSMNLGQAVAVCLYELAARAASPHPDSVIPEAVCATRTASSALERLAGIVDAVMRASNYSPGVMYQANRHDLRLLLRRLTLSPADTRRILGLFRRIQWRMNRDQAESSVGEGRSSPDC